MYVAGDPSVALVALTCLGGYLSAGGAGAVNHWYDRDIDARMARTADRPIPSGRVAPARRAGLRLHARRALLPGAVADRQRARREPLVRGLPRLRLPLHGLAEAAHAAEHRDRRRRRRDPAARRLGGRHGLGERHGGAAVLHRLLLDPAPLLGAVAADEGRVREGRRADAARRARRGRDAPADPALHGPALRRHAAALLRRAASATSTSSPRSRSASASSPARSGSTAGPTGAAPCSSTSSPSPTSRCCSARWSPTLICRMRSRP